MFAEEASYFMLRHIITAERKTACGVNNRERETEKERERRRSGERETTVTVDG